MSVLESTDNGRIKTYKAILRLAITVSWSMLFVFALVKFVDGEKLNIIVQSDNFVKATEFIDSSWVKYAVSFVTVFVAKYLELCAVSQKLKFKNFTNTIACLLILSIWIISNWVSFAKMNFWYGYAIIVVWGIFTQKGWKKCVGAVACGLEVGFSALSMFIRGIDLDITLYQSALPSLVLCIDFYLMLVLFYLYSNILKGDGKKCHFGLVRGGLRKKKPKKEDTKIFSHE